jgi:inorganic triphosphatase YgiF
MAKKRSPGSRNGTDAREIELKFSGLDGAQLRVQQSALIKRWAVRDAVVQPVKSTYFDTKDHDVRAAGYTLRLRQKAGQWRQTVKSLPARGSLNIDRFEAETKLKPEKDFPHLKCLQEVPELARVLEEEHNKLLPYLRTDMKRWQQVVRWGECTIEIAADDGKVVAWPFDGPLRECPLSQIELELVDGPIAGLFDFADALAAECQLQLVTETKEAIGQRLMRDGREKLPKWRSIASNTGPLPVLWAQQSASMMMRSVELLREGETAAIAPLRRGLKALAMMGKVFPSLAEEAEYKNLVLDTKLLRKALKTAHHKQRFKRKVLPPMNPGARTIEEDQLVVGAFARAFDAQLAAAEAQAVGLAASPDVTAFLLKVMRFASLLPQQKHLWSSHHDKDAQNTLERVRKRLRKAAKAQDLPRARQAAGELELIGVAFSSLGDPKKSRTWRKQLRKARKGLQQAGLCYHARDICLETINPGQQDTTEAVLQAMGASYVMGWCAQMLEASQRDVYEAAKHASRRKNRFWP